MAKRLDAEALEDLTELLAAAEHERWARWQRYLQGRCVRQPDGGLLIPADLVERWERQMETPYLELPEEERKSDRELVERLLPEIEAILARDRSR